MTDENAIFCYSIKQSKKRGMWQIKGANHELVSLLGMHPLIHQVLPEFGVDRDDRSSLLKLCMSAQPFDGAQMELIPVTDRSVLDSRAFISGQGPLYQVDRCIWPEVTAVCEVPRQLIELFPGRPPRIYASFERTEYAQFM